MTATPDFRALFEALPENVLVLAPDAPRFTILGASDAYLAVSMRERAALMGHGLFESFPDSNPANPAPVGVAALRASLECVLRTRATHRMDVVRYDIRRPDGSWVEKHWAPRNTPVLAGDGSVQWILHEVEDVTERMKQEEAVSAAERRAAELRAVLESMTDAVYIGTEEGMTLVNDAAVAQLGFSGRDDLERSVRELVEEIDTRDPKTGRRISAEDQPFSRALRGERVVRNVLVRNHATGDDRIVRCAAAPVIVEGRVIAAVAVNTDVTRFISARRDLEAARDAAEAEHQRSSAVLASIADAFYLLDHDWRFTYVNDAAEPLLKTTRDKLLGHTLWEMFPGVIGSPFEGPYREAMATGRVTSAEAYFPPLDTYFDVRTYPWTGGLMVHFRDIGQRKRDEAEREHLLELAEEARREAEAANRAKSEFLAVMSHELRTPLNAIGGYAELMELGIRGPITPEQRADLARIQQSQRHLLGLINGVLNYARVEAGAVHYAVSDVTLEDVLSTCEALVMPQVRTQGLTLEREPCDPSLRVRADAEKLQQVLLNLLSNAVKFTEPGGEVRVRCEAADKTVRIEVRDTGIGIATEQLSRVFEPFVQVDAKLTRTREGTGLGLAISRDLARGMGGDITATSDPGKGSTFVLELPRA
ncbi:MAG TPA: PAS domain-containing protein [Gemmatimonadaceae bacterium]|nr:PAS domain-containing protein [Gemmatimonadaceae bacterium]